MKIARLINAVLYLIAIAFIICYLVNGNIVYMGLYSAFLGVASIALLSITIIEIKIRKKNKRDTNCDDATDNSK